MQDQVIYLDYHASTPCDPRVVDAMLPFFVEHFANPASVSHAAGVRAEGAVAGARASVARVIGASPHSVVFTSGATEANNLAILGLARGNATKRRRILATSIEHKAVLAACASLQGEGFEFVEIPVDREGTVELGALVDLVDDRTLLVSIQAASNEIGTIQPVAEAAMIAHRVGAAVHCDAAQALGRIPVAVDEWDVDLLSLSSHKCYGPKGVGALFVRGGPSSAPIAPLMFGGGQEGGLRPGTLNVPAIVGFGRACDLVSSELNQDAERARALRDHLETLVLAGGFEVRQNGALHRRLPGNSSLRFPGVEADALLARLPRLALSTGSACTSGAPEPSHVLTAIGLTREEAYSTVRIGVGRFSMERDIREAATGLLAQLGEMRALSAVR